MNAEQDTSRQTAAFPLLAILAAAGIVLGLSMGLRQTFGLFVGPM